IIGVNLFTIQIMQNDFFKNLGKKQYDLTITMKPERAPIFDRSGTQFLAMSKDCFSAFVLPRQIKSKDVLIDFLQTHFPKSVKRLEKNKDKHFMFVQRKLTDNQINIIKESDIEDMYLLKEPSRFYPLESTSTVVGITDIDNNGLSGIELHCNKQLSGKPTTFSLEKDARSGHFYFKKETKIKGETARPITMTLDSDLQFLANQELKDAVQKHGAKEGAVLIIDPHNGDILSMVNYPYFNPNDMQYFDPQKSKNIIISECYEFGSVIKVFAALAALEEGRVKPDEMIDCKGKKTTYIDGRQINTVKAHGLLSFSEIVEKSNNIGIAIVAKRVGKHIYDHYKKMGFGQKTNICFPCEQKGFINPPHKWSKQSIISLSYGYEISATLLQLAKAFCTIARDGVPVQPRLVLSEKSKNQESKKPIYAKKNIETIKKILENTTLRGTAKRARIKGYNVMCKTGTANLLVDGKYSPNDNIFTCAGIIEKGDYQRVIVTFLKEIETKGVYAQSVAVPLFEKIAEKTLIHDKVM
ncbi:peptidoglycan D,D-transpeptidase FtsI family protein, partial [Candidatus Dependentiae bacterium]